MKGAKKSSQALKAGNPEAGVAELAWVRSHPEELQRYRGNWVAILDSRVLTSGPTAREVYAYLESKQLPDALVMRVPADTRPRHRIAHAGI